MVQANIRSIIEDMDMHYTVEGMLEEAVTQGLMEVTGYENGEKLYALTASGRRRVKAEMEAMIEHEIEKLSDD